MRLQPPQKASVMLEITPRRPRHPGTRQRRATSLGESGGKRSTGPRPRLSTCCSTARMISACGTSLLALQLLPSNGMNSRKRTSSGKCSVRLTKAPTSSSLTPRINTQFTLSRKCSSCDATSSSVWNTRACHASGLRVINGNLAATSVSRLRLMFRTPAARSCGKNRDSRTPFVVIPRDNGSGRPALSSPRSSTMRAKSPRTVGSPPVSRTLRTPRPTNKRTRRRNSSAVRASPPGVGMWNVSSPSSGTQYWQRKLHRSVRDMRR
mmetsp:Transcript_48773/g.136488  ORF Transcript_48773/g.136488 Transcript_48773/m.136488 type:complete len:265 (-) Transcript_48773:321-1115(-)